ncbi:MAG: hypothetical protein L3K04_02570 [Thermoplasmata archaeon]|nr:hypothetical protein [Thermoplasmata archaeon]MCI4341533.1 hypothetical protein [Thermoplasmata archaeon]
MIDSPAEPAVLERTEAGHGLVPAARLVRPVRWLLARPVLLVAALVNLVFLLLPFYDANNIPTALSTGAHLTSAFPPSSYNTWVAGPFIYALFIPMHLAYVASGFQLNAAYTSLKAILFGCTAWMSYALYRYVRPRSESLAVATAAFVLANPLWLYVSYIWTEFDILPVAFVSVGYLLLRHSGPSVSDRTRVLSAVALIAVSVYFYWFALVLVPTLLYYAPTRRELLRELVAFIGVFGAMLAFTVYAFAGSFPAFLGSLVGSNITLNRSDSFGLQFFLPLPLPVYLGVAAVIGLVLPLVLRWLRFTEPAALFIVVSLFVFTSAIPMPDNYVFVFPFAVLSFLLWKPAQIRFRWLWGLLGYPVVGLLLINVVISNVQPDGVGLFLFGYDLFHASPHPLTTHAELTAFYWVFNLLVVAAISGSFFLLARRSRTEPARPLLPPTGPEDSPVALPTGGDLRRWRRPAVRGVGILAIIAVLSLVFNAAVPNLVDYRGVGPAPVDELLPSFLPPNGNVVRPIPNATYALDGNTVHVAGSAPALSFNRWFRGDAVTIGGSVGFSGIIPRAALAIDGLPFRLWLENGSSPNLSGSTAQTPTSGPAVAADGNATPAADRSAPHGFNETLAYTGYHFAASSWLNRYYTFYFFPRDPPPNETVLFFLDSPQAFAALTSDGNQTLLLYCGLLTHNSTRSVALGGLLSPDRSNFAVLYPSSTGLSLDLDGQFFSVPLPLFVNGSTDLLLGSAPAHGSANRSSAVNTTALYVTLASPPIVESFAFDLQQGSSFTNVTLASPQVSFVIDSTSTGTHYTVDNLTMSSIVPTTEVAFGKFRSVPYSVEFTLSRFAVSQYAPDRYYLVGVLWATAGPFLLLALTLPMLRRVFDPPASGRPTTRGWNASSRSRSP